MLNYAFELHQALCTSVVARMPDGHVIHGRNLDFGFADTMRNSTFRAQFYKGGKFLFESTQFGGFTGVTTAYKPGEFSMSLNARGSHDNVGIDKYFRIMTQISMGVPSIVTVTRDAMTSCADYDCFRDTILDKKTVTEMYVIIAGKEVNQGTIISKAEKGADDIKVLDDEHWYLVQTNDDHFKGICQ